MIEDIYSISLLSKRTEHVFINYLLFQKEVSSVINDNRNMLHDTKNSQAVSKLMSEIIGKIKQHLYFKSWNFRVWINIWQS